MTCPYEYLSNSYLLHLRRGNWFCHEVVKGERPDALNSGALIKLRGLKALTLKFSGNFAWAMTCAVEAQVEGGGLKLGQILAILKQFNYNPFDGSSADGNT